MLFENSLSCWQCVFKALALLIIANGMPVLSRNIFGSRFAWPIDFGLFFFDHRPLFGYSKTWRGIFSSIFVTGLLAPALGFTAINGALFALLVMLGDLTASFIKRRLGYIESSRFRFVDVLPESMLPIFMLRESLEITALDGFIIVALFFIFEVILSPILFRLHIRKRPY
jgi:CDP-2,3-bis-(O-geranylgeranyl)-sn-glycerol synthase